jgi:hypothetical protein
LYKPIEKCINIYKYPHKNYKDLIIIILFAIQGLKILNKTYSDSSLIIKYTIKAYIQLLETLLFKSNVSNTQIITFYDRINLIINNNNNNNIMQNVNIPYNKLEQQQSQQSQQNVQLSFNQQKKSNDNNSNNDTNNDSSFVSVLSNIITGIMKNDGQLEKYNDDILMNINDNTINNTINNNDKRREHITINKYYIPVNTGLSSDKKSKIVYTYI